MGEALLCAFCGARMVAPEQEVEGVAGPAERPRAPRESWLPTVSLVLGLLGFATVGVTALFGLILGIVSLVQIQRSQGRLRGEGLAVGGIVASAIALFIFPLMAAMLFPVFARSREKARTATCQSNLKQIALAATMYYTDWGQRWPTSSRWCDDIYPYIKNQQLFVCPSLPTARSGYAYNAALAQLPMAKLSFPAQTGAVFDAKGGGWNLAGGAELADLRHNQGANVAFADGHVKWISKAGITNPQAVQWNPGSASR